MFDEVIPRWQWVRLPTCRYVIETGPGVDYRPFMDSIISSTLELPDYGAMHAGTGMDHLLFSLLAEAKHGVVELDVPDGTTVYEAISRFDIPLNDESVIVLNGLTVDMNTPLKEGDMVTAFSAIAGG